MKTLNLTPNYVQLHGTPNDGKAIIEFGCGRVRLRLHITRSLLAPIANTLWKFLVAEKADIIRSERAMQDVPDGTKTTWDRNPR